MKTVSVVLGTYNEKDNIIQLIKSLLRNLKTYSPEIIVVDDSSPDGTAEVVRRTFGKRVQVIVRRQRGLATALHRGISEARGDVVLLMDADFSHDPEQAPRLVEFAMRYGAANGSRFRKGGMFESRKHRSLGTQLVQTYAKVLMRSNITDFTNGYVAVQRKLLMSLDLPRIFYGYGDYGVRLFYRLQQRGVRVAELPVKYRSRTKGITKTREWRTGLMYQWNTTVFRLKTLFERPDSGTVFDYSIRFFHKPNETGKFLNYYFTDKEVKGKVVLDAGSRVGDYSVGFLNKGAKRVTGLDLSGKCVQVASRRFKSEKRLSFIQGNIIDLSLFKDSTFDIVFCIGSIFYLEKKLMRQSLLEFMRVCKPGGIVLVGFQKDKGFTTRLVTQVVNLIPLAAYVRVVEHLSFLILPLARKLVGRNISLEYLKYDILLSLRGLHYGVPLPINKSFRIKTAQTQHSSEKTTATYKIVVPRTKDLRSISRGHNTYKSTSHHS